MPDITRTVSPASARTGESASSPEQLVVVAIVPISNTTFERWWKKAILAADVRYRNPHMARHSFVTRLRELGVKLEDIKWIVGHESIATTEDTYSHPNMDELGERIRNIVGATA
jgi:integrase